MVDGVNLPYATDVVDMVDAPIVGVRDGDVYLDGTHIDSLSTVSAGKSRLRGALEAKRNDWQRLHTTSQPRAVAVLQLPMDLPLRDAHAVLHEVFAAGFSETSFMVRNIPRAGDEPRIALLPVDAVVRAPAADEKVLHIEIRRAEKYVLIWKQGSMVVSVLDVPRSAEQEFERGGATVYDMTPLAAKVQTEWQMVGAHRDPADAELDRAVVQFDKDAKLAQAIAAIDAVRKSHRPVTTGPEPKDVSTFRVALSEPAPEPPPPSSPFGDGRIGQSRTSISVRPGNISVSAGLPPEVVQRIIRQNFGRFRLCYENGLRNNPDLAGMVAIKLTINRKGEVENAVNDHSALPDPSVVSCIARGFSNLSFPQPDHGDVKVRYEIIFNPG